jgi:DnaJ-class molecular chaperone
MIENEGGKMKRDRYSEQSRFIYGVTPSEFDRQLFGMGRGDDRAIERFGSPHTLICPTCGGSSFILDECPRCHGNGRDPFYIFEKCLKCKGTGARQVHCPNPDCQGGYVVIRY